MRHFSTLLVQQQCHSGFIFGRGDQSRPSHPPPQSYVCSAFRKLSTTTPRFLFLIFFIVAFFLLLLRLLFLLLAGAVADSLAGIDQTVLFVPTSSSSFPTPCSSSSSSSPPSHLPPLPHPGHFSYFSPLSSSLNYVLSPVQSTLHFLQLDINQFLNL